MALAINAATPAAKNGGLSGQTITSNTFSPPAGSLLVVLASSAVSSGVSSAASVTDSLGSHLTWVKLKEVIGTFSGGSGIGSSTIWVADCPSAQTNMTATATLAGTIAASDAQICVLVLTGTKAAASQSGGTTSNVQFSGVPSLTVSATAAGSLVVGLFVNDDANTAPTVPTGQTTTFNGNSFTYNDTSGAYFWVQAPTALTSGSGSVTINDTAPTISAGWGVAIEILAGSTSISGTGTGSFGFTGSATGSAHLPATGSGSFSFVGSATGSASGSFSGTGTGSFGFTGSATGSAFLPATGAGSFSFAGSSTGSAHLPASGTGSFTFAGAATGAAHLPATATGVYSFTGTAAGQIAGQRPPPIWFPTGVVFIAPTTQATFDAPQSQATFGTGSTAVTLATTETAATFDTTETAATIQTEDVGG